MQFLFTISIVLFLAPKQGAAGYAQLKMSLDQYLNVAETTQNSDQVVQAHLFGGSSFILGSVFYMDSDLIWSGNEDTFFYNIKNLNLSFGHLEKIIIGVHQESWNTSLEYWGSSEWNPQLQRNKLRVQDGGLPGIFYKRTARSWSVTAMYSPYFLPHSGPGYDFTGGNVVSYNPWFLSPPTSVPYEGQEFQTSYDLNEPRIADFLNVPAYMAALEFRPLKDLALRVNWARKANPHMLLDLNFTADATKPEVPIDVLVKPRIAEHDLKSIEAAWNVSQRSVVRASILRETFRNSSFNTDHFTYQLLQDQNVYSLVIEQQRPSYDLTLGVLYRDGGGLGSVGELSSALVHQSVRHIYQRAIKATLGMKNLWQWQAQGSVAYDWQQEGFIATLNVKRSVNQNAFFELGVDAIEPLSQAPEASFIYQYRNLDRVWAGVGYVF